MAEKLEMRARSGWTLVEIMVAVVILASALMLVLGLMPGGVLSLQKAENLQAATAFGEELLETAPAPESFPVTPETFQRKANGTDFEATRSVRRESETTYLIEVSVNWSTAERPLLLELLRFDPYLDD